MWMCENFHHRKTSPLAPGNDPPRPYTLNCEEPD
jgi:hypothetical protein